MITSSVDNDFYASRKTDILKDYDITTGEVYKGLLSAYYGDESAKAMVKEIRDIFEELIPGMPYVGGDQNWLTGIFFQATPHLALYKVLKAHGKATREIGKIIYLTLEIYFDRFPPTYMAFADMDQNELFAWQKHGAAESQKKEYPGDWVYKIFDPDENGEFDFGYDEYECGLCKFFDKHGAMEIMPYVCLADFVMSRACGTGLVRYTTLAEGADRCDFRYKYGRSVTQGWPPDFLTPKDFKFDGGK